MRLFPNRVSKESPRWCLWRWYDIVLNGDLYLTRLNIIQTPWFSVKLHWIHRPDPDRDLHDHPWPFMAFVLRGGYEELESYDPKQQFPHLRIVNWFNYKNTQTAHRIVSVKPKTMTLIISGPRSKSKKWGFYDVETRRYIDAEEYNEQKHKGSSSTVVG